MKEYTDLDKLISYINNKPEYKEASTSTEQKDLKGKIGEVGFVKCIWHLRQKRFKIFCSTKKEDRFGHWDFAIVRKNIVLFDTKNNMTVTYANGNISVWVEIRNIYGGYGSGLGKSNCLAFRYKDVNEYIIVPRLDVVKLIEEKTKMSWEEIFKLKIKHEPGFVPRYTAHRRKRVYDVEKGKWFSPNDIIFKVPIEDIRTEIKSAKLFSEGHSRPFKNKNKHPFGVNDD
jgi:hypothetical protein